MLNVLGAAGCNEQRACTCQACLRLATGSCGTVQNRDDKGFHYCSW